MKIYILAAATFCLKLVNVMFWNLNIKRNYMLAQIATYNYHLTAATHALKTLIFSQLFWNELNIINFFQNQM